MIEKVARPFGLVGNDNQHYQFHHHQFHHHKFHQHEMDLDQLRKQAVAAMNRNSVTDRGKAKVQLFKVDVLVLLKNEERNQTKLYPKYRGRVEDTNCEIT